MQSRTYLAIDLKSFYASVECRERDLDPLDTHLVVADETRTDKTICLAVTPSLKSYGISGRGRLFEVRQRVKQVNAERQRRAPGHTFTGASYSCCGTAGKPVSCDGFHHRTAAYGALYGVQQPDLCHLHEICRAGGHGCVLH